MALVVLILFCAGAIIVTIGEIGWPLTLCLLHGSRAVLQVLKKY